VTQPTTNAARSGGFHGASIPMGEIGVARDNGTLRTFLGSCVGLALYDRRRKIAGLAHVVLPESRGQRLQLGKYADTAVQELLRLLREMANGEPIQVTAKLAGGAKMFGFQSGVTIGDQNVQAIESLLSAEGITIVGRCCGGEHGRRMSLDVASGTVTIQTVGITPDTIL
jgi:chemotaxis protein CheD